MAASPFSLCLHCLPHFVSDEEVAKNIYMDGALLALFLLVCPHADKKGCRIICEMVSNDG